MHAVSHTHVSMSSNTAGATKLSSDHSSSSEFWMGVPVSSSRDTAGQGEVRWGKVRQDKVG